MKNSKITALLLSAVLTLTALPLTASASAGGSGTDLLAGITPMTSAYAKTVPAVGLDNQPLAEGSGNKYLHFYGQDAKKGDGVKVSFEPISGISEYYIEFYTRYANDSANNISAGTNGYGFIRIEDLKTCKLSNTWGVGDVKGNAWTSGTGKYTGSKITVTGTDTVSVKLYKENRADYPIVPFDIDNLTVYYMQGGSKTTLADWDFEDSVIEDGRITYGDDAGNPIAWIEAADDVTTNQMGAAAIALQTEHGCVQYADLSGEKGLTYTFDEPLDPAIYTVSADMRMNFFPSAGAETVYDEADFVTELYVTDGEGNLVGTIAVTPEWGASAELSLTEPTASLTFTADRADVIDFAGLSLTRTGSFDTTLPVYGGVIDSVNLFTTDSVTEVKKDVDNGYLHVYNRTLGLFEGVGIKLAGETLNAGETYRISFEARKANSSIKNIAITLAESTANAEDRYFILPTECPEPYFVYKTCYGAMILDDFNEYVYEYTPVTDVTDPVFYLMSNHYWNSNADWLYWDQVRYGAPGSDGHMLQNNLTVNPFDIDNVKICRVGDESHPIIDDSFDEELPGYYAPSLGNSQSSHGFAVYGAGGAKIKLGSGGYITFDGKGSAPELEFSDIDPEPGKYAFEAAFRLNEYDPELDGAYNKASLILEAEFSDGSSDRKEYIISTEWTDVAYSFFTSDTLTLEKLRITFDTLGEGYTKNIGRIDAANVSVTDQIFTIQADSNGETVNLLDGASIYSVGDTVVTEVTNEDGTPDGYLRVYDRPFASHDGAGVQLSGVRLNGGESYLITLRARKSHPGEKDIALTAAGSVPGANGAYWAIPQNPPAPYQSGNGVVIKDEWQSYTFRYTPAEDAVSPIIYFTSNHYYQERTNSDGDPIPGRIAYWNSVRVGEPDSIGSLPQNSFVMAPFDIDDLKVTKIGSDIPVYTQLFDGELTTADAAPAMGYSQSSRGYAEYGKGGAKLMTEFDVYESVVNEKSAPTLNISDLGELEPGKYILKAQLRADRGYDGTAAFDNQTVTPVSLEVYFADAGGELSRKTKTFNASMEWSTVSLIFDLDEGMSLDSIVLGLKETGSFDYRGLSLVYVPTEPIEIPDPGIIMMLVAKARHSEDFYNGKKSDKPISPDRLPNYLDGALTESGLAYWSFGDQTMTLMSEGEVTFLRAGGMKNNYSGFVFENGRTLREGTYQLTMKVRTAKSGTEPRIRFSIGDIVKTVRISDEWQELTFLLELDESMLRFKLSGGPLAFSTDDFDVASLSLICLDQLAKGQQVTVGGNLFGAGSFDDPSAASLEWNGGANEKQGWTAITVSHVTEKDGNGAVQVSGRCANHQPLDLNTGVPVTEGETYLIKFRVRTADGRSVSGMRTYAGATAKPSYKLKVGNEGSPDPASSWYNSFEISGQWKNVATTYVAEAGGALHLRFSGDTAPESMHDLLIDGIEVYRVFVG